MPQETNLNVSPYFDDFSEDKNFNKVLFKPGYPIQARELTTLQSILQNQIERFGNNIFKDGSPVIDGTFGNDIVFPAVQIESEYNGLPISLYFDKLLDKKIKGQTSGVVASVRYILTDTKSERGVHTLYLQYLQNGGEDFSTQTFLDGETLLVEDAITYGGVTIPQGQGFANTIATNASTAGSSISITDGIFFVRGFFVKAKAQRIILDQYGITPTYQIGFNIIESIVTSDEDESLLDNAQGFSNFSAPGADRFKIDLQLAKKDFGESTDKNFILLYSIKLGTPLFKVEKSEYNLILDEMARRTSDISGDFLVKPFKITARECLNDRVTNVDGVYFSNETTIEGNTPTDDLFVCQVSSGKAYVDGYEVETIAPKFLDVEKPRTTKTLEQQSTLFNAGSLLVVNNITGSPAIGLGTTSIVSLMNARVGSDPLVASGTTIGYARVYDCIPQTSYTNDSSNFDLRLFDIQTTTNITVSTNITQTVPAFIQGKNSKANGYLKENVSNGTSLTLYNVSGGFLQNEPIIINGIENGRLITDVTDHTLADIKSVFTPLSGISSFSADVNLTKKFFIAPQGSEFNITLASGGISTVSSGLGTNFAGILKSGDIITYSNPSLGDNIIFNKVQTVSAGGTNFSVSAVQDVAGVCVGSLPTQNITVTNLRLTKAFVNADNTSLLTALPRQNLESLDVTNSSIIQRRFFENISFASEQITISLTEADLTFAAFDEDRYVIVYSDGTLEPLSSDQYGLSVTGKSVTFSGLSQSSGTANVIATIVNSKPNSKTKKFNSVGSLVVSNSKFTSSGIGTTTLNDGLTYSQVYGLRVQDEDISLNVPDVVRVLGVFESNGTGDPTLPQLTLTSFSGPTANNQDFVLGERIIGQSSGAVAVVTNKIATTILEYVYINDSTFTIGETVTGQSSAINAIVSSKTVSSKNITSNFTFDDGQRDTFYDYSRLSRKIGTEAPKGRLRIIYQYYTVDSADTGEYYTVNSYPESGFKTNVPSYNDRRLSDYIDIRPRVSTYVASSRSPFEFDTRSFSGTGQSINYTLAPEENLNISYSYYLPRVDRIVLNPDGTFEVVKGVPADFPKAPPVKASALDVAEMLIPAYVYNTSSIFIRTKKHKRYRMKDISLLEDRIDTIEEFTTLNMLEKKASSLTIKDAATGLDMFKSGLFADDFTDNKLIDYNISQVSQDPTSGTIRPLVFQPLISLELGSEVIANFNETTTPNADKEYITDIGDNIKKTGNIVTLDYLEQEYLTQNKATRTENVTAFLISFYLGTLTLNPTIAKADQIVVGETKFETKQIVTNNEKPEDQTYKTQPYQKFTTVDKVVVLKEPKVLPTVGSETSFKANLISIVNSGNGKKGTIIGSKGAKITVTLQKNGQFKFAVNQGKKNSKPLQYEDVSDLLPPLEATALVNEVKKKKFSFKIFDPGKYFTSTEQGVEVTETTDFGVNDLGGDVIVESKIIPQKIDIEQSESEEVVETDEDAKYLLSRNIEFSAKALKPSTQHFAFFGPNKMLGKNINVGQTFVIPKLLEIQMQSGTFEVGETVKTKATEAGKPYIAFRVAIPNHKEGPYNDNSTLKSADNPNGFESYTINPYTLGEIESAYSTASTILNVDTYSLQDDTSKTFEGNISPNMLLVGESSGAIAQITNIRLVTDNKGTVQGAFFIPDSQKASNPSFFVGESVVTITDVEDQSLPPGTIGPGGTYLNQSIATAVFTSSGTITTQTTVKTTTINTKITPSYKQNWVQQQNITVNTTTIQPTVQDVNTQLGGIYKFPAKLNKAVKNVGDAFANNVALAANGDPAAKASLNLNPTLSAGCPYDPLAQTFYIAEYSGAFVTSVEVFFKTKPAGTGDNITMQLRPVENGTPTSSVLPYAEVSLTPDEVNVSVDGTVGTKFTFPSPIYLNGPTQLSYSGAPSVKNQFTEYAIVLLSNSKDYTVFIARLGEPLLTDPTQTFEVPTLTQEVYGSLFKSQNGYTWTPSQLDDLKFSINRAQFVEEGTVTLFNAELGDNNSTVLAENKLIPLSKKIIVGLGSTGYDATNVVSGVSIVQPSTGATGTLTGIADSIAKGTSSTTITNAGVGYTNGTFTNISLVTDTGVGQGAVANVTVSGNVISQVDITDGGFAYEVGDSLLIPELGQNVGFGGQITVATLGSTLQGDTFIIEDVQGQFTVGTASTLHYLNSAGVSTHIGLGCTVSTISNDSYNDGLHMRVIQPNHSMHASNNFVKISELRPMDNDLNSELTVNVTAEETTELPLVDATGFDVFEGVTVSANNPGYVIVGDEVIKYEAVSGNSLTTLTRAQDGTQATTYVTGDPVYRYQFNGISLRRLNKIHSFAEVDLATHPIDSNTYYIKVDTGATDFDGVGIGSDRENNLYFATTETTGEYGTVVSRNIQFDAIKPAFNGYVVTGTNITGQVRTTSGTSIGGNEVSFEDEGFEEFDIASTTFFDTPRLIASEVNADRFSLPAPGNRSLSINLLMNTTNNFVSPFIDINNITSLQGSSNIINNPIGIDNPISYANDDSVRSLFEDNHDAIYVSKAVSLKIPANSLKVIVTAALTDQNDIRVLYRLFRSDSPALSQNFELFPGYSNYYIDGIGNKKVIDPSKNDGTPDLKPLKSAKPEDKSYTYTVGDLPDFDGFAVKIVMASKNQAVPPIIYDVSAIATVKPVL